MQIVQYASTLGFKPGEWPKNVNYEKRDWVFHRSIRQRHGEDMGQLQAMVYRPVSGEPNLHDELHILND